MKFFTSFKRSMMVIVFSIVSISTASANIIWDYSPDTTGASGPNNYSNQSGAQNFLELVTFTSGGTITGMDIFSGDFVGNVGDSVDIKIWSNMTGSLGFPIGAMPANPIVTLNEIISVVDIEGTSSFGGITRKFAAFTNAYSFTAGNYWIGMSGSGNT
ncbi:MAG: hypothetical protein KAI89_07605, partial [Emcibacter sp.]|nr:hypothetical protein [Emcibacter sp.]